MDDHIFHFGIVDGALRPSAPGLLGLGIAVEKTDEVDPVQIDEIGILRDDGWFYDVRKNEFVDPRRVVAWRPLTVPAEVRGLA